MYNIGIEYLLVSFFICLFFINFFYFQAKGVFKTSKKWKREKAYRFLEDSWLAHGNQTWMSEHLDISEPVESPKEIFSTLLMLDLLIDEELNASVKKQMVQLIEQACLPDGTFYFFHNQDLLPRDVDTTTFGITILKREGKIADKVAEEGLSHVLRNCVPEGMIEVYLSPKKKEREGRLDPAVCANVLYALTQAGRQGEAEPTIRYLHQALKEETYLEGTLYYPSPDAFLYFVARVVSTFPMYQAEFADLLKEKIRNRMGASDQALELSMRILAAKYLGIECEKEQEKLAAQQLRDGSWPAYTIFKGNSKYKYFGSRELTTAFAIQALKGF